MQEVLLALACVFGPPAAVTGIINYLLPTYASMRRRQRYSTLYVQLHHDGNHNHTNHARRPGLGNFEI